MPFWNNSSKEASYRRKLEHKMCVAKETPEPIFDLADCNLSEVPPGVFSMCRVFLKEVLLLQTNHLHSLAAGGSMKDLSHLKMLNLSYNKFCSLPEEIGTLVYLEVFNLEGNKLKKLPTSFEKLKKLQSLNLKSNKFQEFPMVLCNLESLRNMNLCNNKKLKVLPKEFSNLLSLENLELDSENMEYPPPDTFSEGTESVLKFLCDEAGKSYIPSSGTDSLQQNIVHDEASDLPVFSESPWNDPNLSASYQQYQRIKEQKRMELLQMEEALRDDQELQARFAADASVRRQKLLEDVTLEQERLEDEILHIQSKKDKERQILLAVLSNIEDHSEKLLDQLMCLNEKNKHQDLLEVLEQDRLEAEEYLVKQEELEELRKKDILDAMKDMLQAEERQRQYEAGKLAVAKKLKNSVSETDLKLLDILCGREQDQQILIKKLMEEEYFQKEAFEVLQMQKDKRHSEISYQIKLIEEELSKLTLAELKKKDLKVDVEVNILAERRTALAQLLTDLLEAKENREKQLQNILQEMELKRLDEIQDFWLIQYQKLLDRKPVELIDAELRMDPIVRAVVIEAGASDYLTLFARKAVTWPQLLAMTIKDLKRIGILDENICEAILNKAREYFLSSKLGVEDDKWINEIPRDIRAPETPEDIPSPSAPSEESEGSEEIAEAISEEAINPTAPMLSPGSEVKLWCQTECVICLDQQSSAVFLPCGHVCCCWSCSTAVDYCPMCRISIASKFSITFC